MFAICDEFNLFTNLIEARSSAVSRSQLPFNNGHRSISGDGGRKCHWWRVVHQCPMSDETFDDMYDGLCSADDGNDVMSHLLASSAKIQRALD